MLSEQILIDRAGNFTASENHKLMARWDERPPECDFPEFGELHQIMKPMFDDGNRSFLVGEVQPLLSTKVTGKMIGQVKAALSFDVPPVGLVTYAEEKAMETLFHPDPSLNFKTTHTVNGEEREIDCMFILSKKTGIDFQNIGEEQVHIHANEIGCTPDGVARDDMDLISTGAEVKCKSPLVHGRSLLMNDATDMIKETFDHYVQVQTAMLVTGADHWYFANYNPFAKTEELQFKYIVVNRDDIFIKKLRARIEMAKKIKHEFLERLANATLPQESPALGLLGAM